MREDTINDLLRVDRHLRVGAMLVDQTGQRRERLRRAELVLEQGEERQAPRLETGAGPDPPSP